MTNTRQCVIAVTGHEDPMWPFLQEACDKSRRLVLFATDKPRDYRLSYGWQSRPQVVFETPDGHYNGEDLLGIWWRRVIPPALPHFDPRLREYCQTEYRRFYDNLEFFLPQITWVSRPSAIARAKNKGLQLLLAKDLGFTILHSMFTNNPRQATDWLIAEKIIYKAIDNPRVPLEEGKISTVFTTELSEGDAESCKGLLSCPGILQQYSPKAADIRVTVINNTVFAVLIDSQRKPTTKLDFRTGSRDLKHEIHSLPYDIEEKCRKLVARLGLKFGAIDLALLDDGSYVFFEINANGQWGWLEQKTNLPMRKTLLDYLFVSPA